MALADSSDQHFEALAAEAARLAASKGHPPSLAKVVASLAHACALLAERIETLEGSAFPDDGPEPVGETLAAEDGSAPAVLAADDLSIVEASSQTDLAPTPRGLSGLVQPVGQPTADDVRALEPVSEVVSSEPSGAGDEPIGAFRVEEVEAILEERQREVDARFQSIQKNDAALRLGLRQLLTSGRKPEAAASSPKR